MTTCLSDLAQNAPGTSSEGENASPLGIQEFLEEHTSSSASQKRNPEKVLAKSVFEMCVYLSVDYLKMGNALMDVNGLFCSKVTCKLN